MERDLRSNVMRLEEYPFWRRLNGTSLRMAVLASIVSGDGSEKGVDY